MLWDDAFDFVVQGANHENCHHYGEWHCMLCTIEITLFHGLHHSLGHSTHAAMWACTHAVTKRSISIRSLCRILMSSMVFVFSSWKTSDSNWMESSKVMVTRGSSWFGLATSTFLGIMDLSVLLSLTRNHHWADVTTSGHCTCWFQRSHQTYNRTVEKPDQLINLNQIWLMVTPWEACCLLQVHFGE